MIDRKCKICGNNFQAKSSKADYCSAECKRINYNNLAKLRKGQGKTLKCVECGNMFIQIHGHQKTCSNECRTIRFNRQRVEANRRKKARDSIKTRKEEKAYISKAKSIVEIAKIAKEKGMTYGQYVAERDS